MRVGIRAYNADPDSAFNFLSARLVGGTLIMGQPPKMCATSCITLSVLESTYFYSCEQPTFGFAVAAIDGPVVVAVVVGGALAVVQQTVTALFQRQSAVRAQIELIAIVGVWVRLFAVLFRTLRGSFRAVFLALDHCEKQNKFYVR